MIQSFGLQTRKYFNKIKYHPRYNPQLFISRHILRYVHGEMFRFIYTLCCVLKNKLSFCLVVIRLFLPFFPATFTVLCNNLKMFIFHESSLTNSLSSTCFLNITSYMWHSKMIHDVRNTRKTFLHDGRKNSRHKFYNFQHVVWSN